LLLQLLLLLLLLLLPLFLPYSLLSLSPLPLLVRHVMRREIDGRPKCFGLRKSDAGTRRETSGGGRAGGREGVRLLLLLEDRGQGCHPGASYSLSVRGRRGFKRHVSIVAVQGEIDTTPSLPPSLLCRTLGVPTSDHTLATRKSKRRGRQRRVLHTLLLPLPPSLTSLLPPVQCGHVRSYPDKPLVLLPSPPQLEEHLSLLQQPPDSPPFLPPFLPLYLLFLFMMRGGGGGGSDDKKGGVAERRKMRV